MAQTQSETLSLILGLLKEHRTFEPPEEFRRTALIGDDAVYREDETVEQNREEGQAQMTSSQDAATAVALEEMGLDVTEPVVAAVSEGTPADGALEPGDVILKVDGQEVTTSEEVVDEVGSAEVGDEVTFVVRRDDERTEVEVTPAEVDGGPQVGISVGTQVKPDLDGRFCCTPNPSSPSSLSHSDSTSSTPSPWIRTRSPIRNAHDPSAVSTRAKVLNEWATIRARGCSIS